MRLLSLLCGLSLLALAALPVQAQWKWKDKLGQVHVSDIPPPREVQDKDILQRPPAAGKRATAPAPAASVAAATASRPATDPELEARRAKAEAEQKAKTKAEEEKLAVQRAENCQRARQHQATLQTGQRIARLNAQGEREILDDKARAVELDAARRVIDSDCR